MNDLSFSTWREHSHHKLEDFSLKLTKEYAIAIFFLKTPLSTNLTTLFRVGLQNVQISLTLSGGAFFIDKLLLSYLLVIYHILRIS